MMRNLKPALVLALVLVVSLALAPFQILATRTGIFSQHRIPRFWHGMVTRLLGFRVRVTGKLSKKRPLLVASNHVSWTDIILFSGVAGVQFIAKSETSGWPGVGTLARLQRTVFVDRTMKRSSGDQAGEIAGRLAAGDAMVLFPEGSTSDGTRLLPFKSTLFGAVERLLATEGGVAEVHIQPAAISYVRFRGLPMGRRERAARAAWMGDSDLAPHMLGLLREGGMDVEIAFGEPIAFRRGANRKEMARAVEAEVRRLTRASLYGR